MIGAVLLGNTLVDVLAASLASGVAIVMVGPAGVVYATAIVTLLIVIFSAVLPKTYALAFSDSVALFVAPIMRVVIALLSPLTAAIQFIVRLILRLTPTKRDDAANILAAHEEIRGTIQLQDHRRRRRQGRCGHARRRARSQEPAGARHHGPSHQDADDRHRRCRPRRSSTRC